MTNYHRRFGKKAKRAVEEFVGGLAASRIEGACDVFAGPEGEIVVKVPTRFPSKMQISFPSLSADVLDKHGVWVIGLAEKPKNDRK